MKNEIELYVVKWNVEFKSDGTSYVIPKNKISKFDLNQMDVIVVLNNLDEHHGVISRSNKGVGSLKIDVDNIGIKIRFDVPNTETGKELLEGLKRGDIDSTELKFTSKDKFTQKYNIIEKMNLKQIRFVYTGVPNDSIIIRNSNLDVVPDIRENVQVKKTISKTSVELDRLEKYYLNLNQQLINNQINKNKF